MKKSYVSDSDEIELKLKHMGLEGVESDLSLTEINILYLLAEGFEDCQAVGKVLGISEAAVRIQKARLRAKISNKILQHAFVQDAEGETETTRPVASPSRGIDTTKSQPPKNAEFLLALLLGKEDQEAALGCFAELYEKKAIRWGKSRARVWAWVQVAKTLAPVLKRVVLKLSGLAAAYEWLKHHLS